MRRASTGGFGVDGAAGNGADDVEAAAADDEDAADDDASDETAAAAVAEASGELGRRAVAVSDAGITQNERERKIKSR